MLITVNTRMKTSLEHFWLFKTKTRHFIFLKRKLVSYKDASRWTTHSSVYLLLASRLSHPRGLLFVPLFLCLWILLLSLPTDQEITRHLVQISEGRILISLRSPLHGIQVVCRKGQNSSTNNDVSGKMVFGVSLERWGGCKCQDFGLGAILS